jgi:hypothetical protein
VTQSLALAVPPHAPEPARYVEHFVTWVRNQHQAQGAVGELARGLRKETVIFTWRMTGAKTARDARTTIFTFQVQPDTKGMNRLRTAWKAYADLQDRLASRAGAG